jgi:uncharacterized protein (DUF169 family)
MDVKDFNLYGKKLEEMFKLRSMPIALKWYEKAEDVPKEAVFPKKDLGKHMALCQAFSYSRMKGMTIAMTKEDHWCWNPLIGFGAVECVPGQPQFDEVCKFIGIPDREKAEKFFEGFPRLPLHKYEAVVTAPLSTASFIPDVVIIYAEAAKINHMSRAVKNATGNTFTSEFDGIDSCIYCTVPSFTKNEYRITFPDPGDRERARARDDEVILTVPGSRMEEFMTSTEATNKFMGFNDRLFEFNLDFPHPPFYNKLFEIWGLDKGEEWKI